MYIVKNVSDKVISIPDIINCQAIIIKPNEEVDLDKHATRNQILFSSNLKKLINKGVLVVVTKTSPDDSDRFLIDGQFNLNVDSISISTKKGRVFQTNGIIINSSPTIIYPPEGYFTSILIKNTSVDNFNFGVSFDGGNNYFQLGKNEYVSIDCEIQSVYILGNIGSTYSVLTTYITNG